MGGVKSNIGRWANRVVLRADAAEEAMADTVRVRGNILAPKDTGDLKSDGQITRSTLGGRTVTFGGESVPYARRRHFENFKNPHTLYYLERAGDSVADEGPKTYIELFPL